MNQENFDSLTRLMARTTGRRAFLKTSAAILAGVGGAGILSQHAGAAQSTDSEQIPVSRVTLQGECVMPFEVAVREGPNADLELRGLLYFGLGEEGEATGRFEANNDSIIDVMGQITNSAVSLRFELPDGQVLYGTGVANGDPAVCEIYDMGGPVVGPEAGDLGDWRTGSLTIDPNEPPLCVMGDPDCDSNVVPPRPEPTPEIPEFPGTCQFEPFTNCLYVCGSSNLRPRAGECLDYCIEVFQC